MENSYLPPELLTQILRRLPSKSLLAFRSVSKSFLTLIDDPGFISSHLRSDPLPTLTLSHTHSFGHFEIRDPTTASAAPLDPLLEPLNARILSSSLDGLVLLASRDEPSLILWNPSTRTTRPIPLPNPLSHSNPIPFEGEINFTHTSTGSRLAALAYDSSSLDYQLLYITYEYLTSYNAALQGLGDGISVRPLGVWVYGVSARSWTTVSAGESGIRAFRSRSNGHARSVFFQGAVVWIEAWHPGDDEQEYCIRMVRFVVGDRKFRYCGDLPFSAEKHKKMESRLVTLDDGGRTLGLCGLDDNDFVSVWSWDGEEGSWIGRYVVPECPVPRFLRFGAFVHLYKYEELSWKYRASDGARKLCTYNLRTGHLSETNPSHCVYYEPDHCAYIQSLIKP